MKNDDQFDDLKQFIEATVSQSEARVTHALTKTIDEKIDRLDKKLSTKMDDGFAGVEEAIEGIHTILDKHENRHDKAETRLDRLERQVA
jgi:ribosome-associated translation inhibitor RaiA